MKSSCAVVGVVIVLAIIVQTASSSAASSRLTSKSLLRTKMASIAAVTHGPVGAAVVVVEGGSVVSLHGQQRFPMQSTYKLLIGMAVLYQVDQGKLNLGQKLQITPVDFPPPADYGPIRDKYPNGRIMTVMELLNPMMSLSDPTACDVLLKLAGGPQRVTEYLRGLGIKNIVVATSEKTMHQNEQVEQYRNWATPDAMANLLCLLQQGKGLSVSSRQLLLNIMIHSETGPNRIKRLLPFGTIVAHKTGSSGTVGGLTRATNDIGLITLPDGKHLAVVVFVSDTRVDAATQEAVIAKIARAAWDCRAGLE
ncbi:MAG: class A beta-lactamase [Janthinobacterium lividum]